jgi:hypothetical protein
LVGSVEDGVLEEAAPEDGEPEDDAPEDGVLDDEAPADGDELGVEAVEDGEEAEPAGDDAVPDGELVDEELVDGEDDLDAADFEPLSWPHAASASAAAAAMSRDFVIKKFLLSVKWVAPGQGARIVGAPT